MREVVTHIDAAQWAELMRESRYASWWQSAACWAYLSACRETQPICVGVKRDGALRGVALGYIVGWRGISARAIFNAGPLLATDITHDELQMLLSAVDEAMQRERVIYAEMRNFADYSCWKSGFLEAGWTYKPHYDVWLDVAENQDARIHETQSRKLRRAQDDGQTWRELRYSAENEPLFDAWYNLLSELYRRKVRKPLMQRESLMAAWRGGVPLLVVEKDAQVIGGVLVPHTEDIAYEWYICGPTMVTYAMMQWCLQQGIPHIDMMGAGEPGKVYGVRDFKLQMGGTLHEWGRYLRVYAPWRYRLGEVAIRLRG